MKVLLLLISFFTITKDYKGEIDQLKRKSVNSPYNKEYGILIDYGLHSGRDRMFIVNLKTEEIVYKCLVAHGEGSKSIMGIPTEFSNKSGSNATSLGFSVINGRGKSRYGIGVKYILRGLDKTNSNMQCRNVVLHSYKTISSFPIYPFTIVESKGCPTVSNKDMKYLDNFIKKNKKILIYSFK